MLALQGAQQPQRGAGRDPGPPGGGGQRGDVVGADRREQGQGPLDGAGRGRGRIAARRHGRRSHVHLLPLVVVHLLAGAEPPYAPICSPDLPPGGTPLPRRPRPQDPDTAGCGPGEADSGQRGKRRRFVMSGRLPRRAGARVCRVITLDGQPLDLATLVAVADGAPVRLGAAGRERAAATHALAVRISGERTVYGRTTGVGANKDAAVSAAESSAHAERLLLSHATSAARCERPAGCAPRWRSGSTSWRPAAVAPGRRCSTGWPRCWRPATVPPVREHGSVGTGDLGQLATIALAVPGWSGPPTTRCRSSPATRPPWPTPPSRRPSCSTGLGRNRNRRNDFRRRRRCARGLRADGGGAHAVRRGALRSARRCAR